MPPPLHLGATTSVTRRACWCVRVRAVVRSERRRSSGSARHTHRPARPSRLRRWEARHGATRGAAEHPPRAAGEGVARSKLVVHQRLGGRARPRACAQRRVGCSSHAAQLTGARLEASVGLVRTAERPRRAPGGPLYPPTPQERVGPIGAAHLAVDACAGRQMVASAAQHEYQPFGDVTRPLP